MWLEAPNWTFDQPSRARELVSSTGSDETFFLAEETIFRERRRQPEIGTRQYVETVIKQWSSVMSAFLTLIYREYCRVRLAEMRKLGGENVEGDNGARTESN
jgi:hypothetical protein